MKPMEYSNVEHIAIFGFYSVIFEVEKLFYFLIIIEIILVMLLPIYQSISMFYGKLNSIEMQTFIIKVKSLIYNIPLFVEELYISFIYAFM